MDVSEGSLRSCSLIFGVSTASAGFFFNEVEDIDGVLPTEYVSTPPFDDTGANTAASTFSLPSFLAAGALIV